MEDDVKVGTVGDVDLKQSAGVASISINFGPLQLNPFLKGKLSAELGLDEVALLQSLITKYGASSILGDVLQAAKAAASAS